MATLPEAMIGFFSLIRTWKEDAVSAFLADDIGIDDPILGKFSGRESFRMFVQGERIWLTKHEIGIEPINQIFSDDGFVVEYLFHLKTNGERGDIPVALAGDIVDGNVNSIRIYFSTWPLEGKNQQRRPIIRVREKMALPCPLDSYIKALRENNTKAVVDLFEEDGYVRDARGERFSYRGKNELEQFYRGIISGSGISLNPVRLVYDGKNAAVEYSFDVYDVSSFHTQAGITIYEISERAKLRSARTYTDAVMP